MAPEFPFLIGTVRTMVIAFTGKPGSGFPFLIGTVRTSGVIQNRVMFSQVSIPHRYGKNLSK